MRSEALNRAQKKYLEQKTVRVKKKGHSFIECPFFFLKSLKGV